MKNSSWILSFIIGLLVILIFAWTRNTKKFSTPGNETLIDEFLNSSNDDIKNSSNDDIRTVRKYCTSFLRKEYRQAEEMKANTVDAINNLIKAKVLNPEKMIPGNDTGTIIHNCKYFYSIIN